MLTKHALSIPQACLIPCLPMPEQNRVEQNTYEERGHPLDEASPKSTRTTREAGEWWVAWAAKMSEAWEPCHYCGAAAESKDHLEARTWTGHRGKGYRGPWVWSCQECNSILSDKRIPDTEDRRDFVAVRLIEMYEFEARRLVDLDGLEGSLLVAARAADEARIATRERLEYASRGRWSA